MFDIEGFGGDIKRRVYQLAEQGLPVKAIARDPLIRAALSVIKPPEICEEFAYHRYLQAMIQRAKNPDGTRRFVSVQRPRLFTLEEEEKVGGRTIFYATLEAVEQAPAYKVMALRGMRRFIERNIRAAGYIAPETREELIAMIGEVFDRMIRGQAA